MAIKKRVSESRIQLFYGVQKSSVQMVVIYFLEGLGFNSPPFVNTSADLKELMIVSGEGNI